VKTFFKRWKKGIMMVTPEQRLKVDFISLIFIIIGCFFGGMGIIITFFIMKTAWWYIAIGIMLLFSGVMNISALITKYQQMQTFKAIKDMENVNDELNKGVEK